MAEAKINIVTSLYRSEADLEAYCENVARMDEALFAGNVRLELIIVANDATDFEREKLEQLKQGAFKAIDVVLIYVDRESIYASWNRGILAGSAPYISFWGVDDTRYAEALIDGIRLLETGYDIVYFPFQQITFVDIGGLKLKNVSTSDLPPFDKKRYSQKMRLGPFWIGTRTIFDKVGLFDEKFLVCGDYEWAIRALEVARFIPSSQLGGVFVASGNNLSGNNSLRKFVEDNVIRLRFGLLEQLVPVEPEMMKTAWENWGKRSADLALSPELEDFLWGEGAQARFLAWRQKHLQKQRSELLRRFPRAVMEKLGLRPLFRKLKIVKR